MPSLSEATVLSKPATLSQAACAALCDAVDRERSETIDTVDGAAEPRCAHLLRRTILLTEAHRQSAIHGLGARCEVPRSMTIAEKRSGHVPPTTGLCGAGVRPTKVLR